MPQQEDQQLRKEIRTLLNSDAVPAMPEEVSAAILTTILQVEGQPAVHIFKRNWLKYAAILILAIGSGIYYFSNQSSKLNAINGGTGEIIGTVGDFAPGTNRAILTINNNQNIDLDSNKTGININNTITYSDGEKIADAGQLLQLTTPRGGQYQAVLPDGSKVWLNAASSIKFPSTFNDRERRVEVTGEVYFEITKDVHKPFKVYGGEQEIEVLGTSFNVNIYDDESIQKTTLVTGSIRVTTVGAPTRGTLTVTLKPNEQVQISTISEITKIKQIKQITVQTNDVLAWKNGYFNFDNADLPTVMRQLERWYDINIQYEGPAPAFTFQGKMDRNLNLSEIMESLNRMGAKLELKGKTLIVRSK